MKITADSILSIVPGQYAARLGDELVVAGIESGNYYGMNEVSTRVWELVGSSARVSEVLDSLVAEYEAPRARVEADLYLLLEQLHDEGLIEVVND